MDDYWSCLGYFQHFPTIGGQEGVPGAQELRRHTYVRPQGTENYTYETIFTLRLQPPEECESWSSQVPI